MPGADPGLELPVPIGCFSHRHRTGCGDVTAVRRAEVVAVRGRRRNNAIAVARHALRGPKPLEPTPMKIEFHGAERYHDSRAAAAAFRAVGTGAAPTRRRPSNHGLQSHKRQGFCGSRAARRSPDVRRIIVR
jgi:hypothetical protein